MRFKYIREDINDGVTYAIKFYPSRTGDTYYVCGEDEDVLYDAEYDIQEAFLDMMHSSDPYWWGVAHSKYENLLEDLGLFELESPVDEKGLYIISSCEY